MDHEPDEIYDVDAHQMESLLMEASLVKNMDYQKFERKMSSTYRHMVGNVNLAARVFA